jgi:hypothetical protein
MGSKNKMESGKAKEILARQIAATSSLNGKKESSPEFQKWKRDTEIAIEKVFGKSGRHLSDLRKISFSPGVYYQGMPANASETRCHSGLNEACQILQSMIEEISEYGVEISTKTKRDSLVVVQALCERLHLIARQLRKRHDNRPTLEVEDEYDTQDLLHALLHGDFDDIRPEEWTPSYAGGSSRMDFLLKQEKTVIEVKKTRKGLSAKEIGKQLIIDIQKYQTHPDCKALICFVYDPEGRITNPLGLENDLNREKDEFRVLVIIAPKGT